MLEIFLTYMAFRTWINHRSKVGFIQERFDYWSSRPGTGCDVDPKRIEIASFARLGRGLCSGLRLGQCYVGIVTALDVGR